MSAEAIWDDLLESVVTETTAQLHRMIKTGALAIASSSSSSSDSNMDRRSLYPDLYPTEEALQQDLERFAVEQPPAAKRMRLETTVAAITTPIVLSFADSGAILADPDNNKVLAQESEPTAIETPSMQLLIIPQDGHPTSHPLDEKLDAVVSSATTTTTTDAAATAVKHDDDDNDNDEPPGTSSTTTPAAAAVADTVPSTPAVPLAAGPQSQPSVVVAASRHHNNNDIWGRNPGKEPFSLISCSTCRNQVSGLRFASHLDKCLGIGTMSRNASSHGNRKS